MFNFFKSKTAKEFKEEAEETYKAPGTSCAAPLELPKHDQVVYRIGKTQEGKVTLSLGEWGGVSITMNNAGVDQLIRMLESSKDVSVPEEIENV
jgi:hypothetical protein